MKNERISMKFRSLMGQGLAHLQISKCVINDPSKSVDLGETCAFSSVFTAVGVDLQSGCVFFIVRKPFFM